MLQLMRRAYLSVDSALVSLNSRGVVRVSGFDTRKFLQNFITNDVLQLTSRHSLHAAMLTPQGRLLYDVFLYVDDATPTTVLIDHHCAFSAELIAHLMRYRLRSQVTIEDVSAQWRVLSLLGASNTLTNEAVRAALPQAMGAGDPRLAALGGRFLVPTTHDATTTVERVAALAAGRVTRADEALYNLYRTCLGVPAEPFELQRGVTLPSEATLDHLNAISYSKGCYLGQELTARTHFRGVTRKMLFPVVPASDDGDGDADDGDAAGGGALFAPWRVAVFGARVWGRAVPMAAELALEAATSEATTTTTTTTTRVRRGGGGNAIGAVVRGGVGAGFAMLRLEQLTGATPLHDVRLRASAGSADDDASVARRLRVLQPHWWSTN